MISTICVAIFTSTPSISCVDQDWKFTLLTVGKFGTPIGIIEDPLVTGKVSIKRTKESKADSNLFRITLSLKRDQSKLITSMSEGLPDQQPGPSDRNGISKDKDHAFFVNSYSISNSNYEVAQANQGGGYSGDFLNPLAMALGVTQRSLNQPELRKEFFLMQDGPRKFSVTLRPNLNANTDSTPGEVAYKFDIKLKDNDGEYPSFFTGAIRLNTLSRKIRYITASSDPEHQPKPPDDADLGDRKSYSMRFDEIEPKASKSFPH